MRRVSTASLSGEKGFVAFCVERVPSGVVLNIGAGNSGTLDTPAHYVIGVDHAPSASTAGGVVADAVALPFRSGLFDGIVMKDVLEHISDPLEALIEAERVTRAGGRMVVVTPRAIPRAVWNDPTHIRGFTSRSIQTALALGGWEPGRPQRVGGIPGFGRSKRRGPWLLRIMAIPGLGHRLGINWFVEASKEQKRLALD